MRDPLPALAVVKRRLRLVVAVGLALLAIALLALLSGSGSSLAYENGKPIRAGAVVPPGGQMCEGGEYLPPHASSLRIWISTAHQRGGPVRLTVFDGTNVVARGVAPGGYRDQRVNVTLANTTPEVADTTVCLRNAGTRTIAVMGDSPLPGEFKSLKKITRTLLGVHQQAAVVTPRTPQPAGPVVTRLEWHTRPVSSWWALIPTVARRLSFAKASFIGSWALWVAAGLMIVVAAAAAWVVTREDPV